MSGVDYNNGELAIGDNYIRFVRYAQAYFYQIKLYHLSCPLKF